MDEKVYGEKEQKIFELVGENGTFAGDIQKKLDLNPTMLKSLVKRSGRLVYRGHRIERTNTDE